MTSDKDFPKKEFLNRWERAQKRMAEHDLDAIIVTEQGNYRYFSGHRSGQFKNKQRPSLFLLPRDGEPVLMVYSLDEPEASAQTWIDDIRTYTDVPFPPELVTETIDDRGLDNAKIGAELGKQQRLWVSPQDWHRITAELRDVEFVNGAAVIEGCRMAKSDREIERIESACEITEDAWELILDRIEPGMTIGEVTEISYHALVDAGASVSSPGFVALDFLDKGDDYEYTTNDFFFIDFGATYKGYNADIARMASFGDPTSRQEQLFDRITRLQDAVIGAMEPGVEAQHVADVCNEMLTSFGYPPLEGSKRIGHGLGIDVQERPSLNRVEQTELVPGTVLTPEPRFVDDNEWIMIEENVVVTSDGVDLLTADRYDELRRIES